MTASCELKALDAINSFELWMTWATLGYETKALDVIKCSKLWMK